MAEETKKTVPEAASSSAEEVVVVSDVPEAEEKPTAVPVAEVEKPAEKEKDEPAAASEEKAPESASSYKEESNKVEDLVDPQKKALDEFKQLIRDALDKHEFTAPPPPPPSKIEKPKTEVKKEEEEEAKPEEPKSEEKKEEKEGEEEEEPKTEEKKEVLEAPSDVPPAEEEADKPVEEKSTPVAETAVEKIEEKAEAAVEEIKETIVHEVTTTQPPVEEEQKPKEEETPPAAPEEVSIWGVPLLADERTDVILLKFLRARDFKVKDAFTMLKNVVSWRKQFKIDELLEEEGIIDGLEKVVFIHGVDKEGHPVCYNAFGEFQNKELYNNTFATTEKRTKFLRWYIQFLERNIRKLDFTPGGICTIVQITDLKNSPGLILFKKELRQATNQALQLLQDNYPEFVAKQLFINVPWWYVAYNRMISPFLTQRTKSKFVFAGPTRTIETLLEYKAPEHVPVRFGGLSKEDGDQEFTSADTATAQIIKPTSKHIIELPITEACTLVWEIRVAGWDVTYGAEFVPTAEDGYTWVVQKSRKIGPGDEQVVHCSFPIGETGKVVLTVDNQTAKKKKLLYRYKTKVSDQK